MSTSSEQDAAQADDAEACPDGHDDAAERPGDSAGSAGDEPAGPRSRWQRLEHSPRGRRLISAGLVVLIGSLLVINAPATETKRFLMQGVGPFLGAIAMEQGWGVFSPDPRPVSVSLEAEIRRQDGSVEVLAVESGKGLNEYWEYQWRRWADRLITGRDSAQFYEAYARWLAEQDRADGGAPVQVALVAVRAASRPPGPGPMREPSFRQGLYAIGVSPR